ncbi:MAG TPA: hypothetical protein VNK52_13565 [Hyphomicrobiaceae bacterium]|nr:hypothetical protein [Hyphomicrobiaceae bacterium]
MRQSNGLLQVFGEMVSIVVLALTGRFIGFAQTALESGVPLTIERAVAHVIDIISVFTNVGNAGVLLSVLVGASLIRIAIAHVNRSVLHSLRARAGIGEEHLSWGQRAIRLPYAVLYRMLNGVATLVGAIALAIAFRLFDPERPFGFAELGAYIQSVAGGLSYGGLGGLFVLFALYGLALAFIGYIASPAVLSLEEMASGCRPAPKVRPVRRPETVQG